MKIVALVRTLNEYSNILSFIWAYKPWVDGILIADGGSTDGTRDLVATIHDEPKVQVREFGKRVQMARGVWRNPEGKHINFLLDWAKDEGADWVIFDDCDCRPNKLLRRWGRGLIEESPDSIINAVRLYWWGKDEHFPHMAQPHGRGLWSPSLWAWKLEVGLRWSEDEPFSFHFENGPEGKPSFNIMPPLCLNHHGWPDLETVERKYQHYKSFVPTALHPTQFAGHLEPLPEWAEE